MSEEGPYILGEIDFKDIKVKVYHHKDSNSESAVWQIRNPDSCYTGYMYQNNITGKLSYPEGAVIPTQTKRDREMLPKFVITGKKELTDELANRLIGGLSTEYKIRNKKDES